MHALLVEPRQAGVLEGGDPVDDRDPRADLPHGPPPSSQGHQVSPRHRDRPRTVQRPSVGCHLAPDHRVVDPEAPQQGA
ncbi:hypothetical protein [Phycicoccus avicenniae]|uniref:hypothetical protein n=1 Tax=Phycicoccus avicenniae TaxID=2828860 RepID=UPI003D2D343C